MKKTWLYGALAGLTLFAAACGTKSAAPNYTNQRGASTTGYEAYNDAAYPHRAGTFGATGYRGYGTSGMTGTSGTTGTTGNYGYTGTTGTTSTYGTGGMTGSGSYGAGGTYGTTGSGTYGTTGTTSTYRMSGTNGSYGPTGLTGAGMTGPTTYHGYGNTLGATGTTRGYSTYNAFGTTNYGNAYTRSAQSGNSMYKSVGMNTLQNNMPSIGYARAGGMGTKSTPTTNNTVYVDRNALAKAVADVVKSVPGVQHSTVLVTDEEIFVGCNTDQSNAQATQAKARMNAMSIAPRYYKVYLTSDPRMIDELTRVASRTAHHNATLPHDQNQIDTLIKRFGGMPEAKETQHMSKTRTGMQHMSNTSGTSSSGR